MNFPESDHPRISILVLRNILITTLVSLLLAAGPPASTAHGAASGETTPDWETRKVVTGLSLDPGEAAVFHWDSASRTLSRISCMEAPPGFDRLDGILEGYPAWVKDRTREAVLEVGTIPFRGNRIYTADLDGFGGALLVPGGDDGRLQVLEPPYYSTRKAARLPLPPGDPVDIAFADADGDGMDDLFTLGRGGGVRLFTKAPEVELSEMWGRGVRLFDAPNDAVFLGAASLGAASGAVVVAVSPSGTVGISRCCESGGAFETEHLGTIVTEPRENASSCGAVAVPLPVAGESGIPLRIHIVFTDGSIEQWDPGAEGEGWVSTFTTDLGLEDPYPAWADLDNDGIADLAAASKGGEIHAWKGIERETSSGDFVAAPMFFRRDAYLEFQDLRRGWAFSPALMHVDSIDAPVLLTADIDGEIAVYSEDGRRGLISCLEGVTRFPRIASGDLDGDGTADLLCGTVDGRLVFIGNAESFIAWEDENAPGKHPSAPSLAETDEAAPRLASRLEIIDIPGETRHAAPSMADLDGDGRPEIVLGAEDGVIRIYEIEAPGPGKALSLAGPHFPAGVDTIPFAAPAAADIDGDGIVDLAIGGADGVLRFYRGLCGKRSIPAEKSGETGTSETGGPFRFEPAEEFAGLDLGEYLCPAFFDMDQSGRPSLVAGNAAGKVLIYGIEDGTLAEKGSWEFEPLLSATTLEDYYGSYKPGYFEVSGYNDATSVDKLLALLEETGSEYRDEVAFSVGNLPPEALRTMLRRDEESILLENVRQIYRLAEKLDYVRIEEKGDSTTLSFVLEPGVEKTCPASVYYWWVVHPRILYELPSRIEASYWENPPEYYGLELEEWLRHEPRPSIYAPSPDGRFWRNSLPFDRRYGESLMDAVTPSATLREAVDNLHGWLTWTRDDDPFMDFGYLTQDLQPLVIHTKHYGSCGEQSILTAACARTALIPIRVVGCRGEDHQWNEFRMNGEWLHWDINNKVNEPWASGEGLDHKAKTISAITGWRGDEKLLDITTEVHNPPDVDYTEAGRGYTDTGRLTIDAVDVGGAPVDGALVILRSHWDGRNMPAVWGHTSTSGRVSFDVGYEPNGGYTVEVLSPWGAAGSSNLPVKEGEEYDIRYTLPGRKITAPGARLAGGGVSSVVALLPSAGYAGGTGPAADSPGDLRPGRRHVHDAASSLSAASDPWSVSLSPPAVASASTGFLSISTAEVAGAFSASAHIGARGRPGGGYLWDEFGYGGVRSGPVEVGASPSDVRFALLRLPAEKSISGVVGPDIDIQALLGGADWTWAGESGDFPLDRDIYFAAANMDAGLVSLDMKIEFDFRLPSSPPFIEIARRERGNDPVIRGTAGDNLGLTRIEASFDGGDTWRDITDVLVFEACGSTGDAVVTAGGSTGGRSFTETGATLNAVSGAGGSWTGRFSWLPGVAEGGAPPAGRYSMMLRGVDSNGSTCLSAPFDYEVAAKHSFEFQPISQDDPDSPLPVSSWMFGPFKLSPPPPFLDIRTEGHTVGLDLDLFLFRDSDGDGAVTGMEELVSKSAGPSSSERLFLDKPENGVYWIYAQGWAAPPGGGEFSLFSSEPLSRGILGLRSPTGVVNDLNPALGNGGLTLDCDYTGMSAPDMDATTLMLDGANVTGRSVFDDGHIRMPLAGLLKSNVKHEVSLDVIDRAGARGTVSWSFTIDRDPPSIKIRKPVSREWAAAAVPVRVRVGDRFGIDRVTCSAPGGEPAELLPAKGVEGVYEGELKLPESLPERCSLTFEAVDNAGNSSIATRRILHIR